MAVPISVATPDRNGIAPMTPVAMDASEGNSIPNRQGTIIVLENTDASDHPITFVTPIEVGTYAVEDFMVNLVAGTTMYFADFPSNVFGHTLEFSSGSALVMVQAYVAA